MTSPGPDNQPQPSAPTGSIGGFGFPQMLGIADALPMPVAMVDRDQRYTFINAAFARFFERRRRDILGRTMREILGEAAYGDRTELIAAAMAGERQWFAADFAHPTRGSLAIQTEYVPQPSVNGTVSGIIVIIQDVTEQRVAERSLRESEARFRRIADSAPVLMWVTRLDRTREFVNEAYAEFAGLTAAQARTQDWYNWIHPDDRARVVTESLAGEATLQPFTLEARYRRADGEFRWLRSVSRPRFGPDGELSGFIGAAFDVTLAKDAELQLRSQVDERTRRLARSEERFRAVFDTTLEMIGLMTLEGEYLEMNRTALKTLGIKVEQLHGRKAWELPPVEGDPHSAELLRRLIERAAAGETAHAELQVTIAGQRATHVTSVKPVIGEDGAPLYLVGEARDITELRGAQEQLRQSQKMEALGQLTGGIAHDFNNLLTVVVGGLDLITKRAEDPRLKRYAVNALEAAERGARLTAQLLAFSRVQRLEPRPTLVAPLIENMGPLLRNVLGPTIEKHFELDENPVPVMADPTQLELAVLNLAINARDAMPDGGVLTIKTVKLRIDDDPELEPGNYVEVSIGDTGTGMPPEVVERAFEPFFTTKEVGKGTGLGLSMVYGVARQSGGTARIVSTPGEGTCIRLFFPHAPNAGEALDESIEIRTLHSRAKPQASVLVVDDDPDVREFIVGSLEELGYRVREASDGEAGLAAWRAEAADLVVLDFLMPGLSGADVARALMAQNPKQPILFVSGYSQTDAIREVAPGAPLLAKPFRTEALDAAVRAALMAVGK
jgi:PAS domain S-box-containing protein